MGKSKDEEALDAFLKKSEPQPQQGVPSLPFSQAPAPNTAPPPDIGAIGTGLLDAADFLTFGIGPWAADKARELSGRTDTYTPRDDYSGKPEGYWRHMLNENRRAHPGAALLGKIFGSAGQGGVGPQVIKKVGQEAIVEGSKLVPKILGREGMGPEAVRQGLNALGLSTLDETARSTFSEPDHQFSPGNIALNTGINAATGAVSGLGPTFRPNIRQKVRARVDLTDAPPVRGVVDPTGTIPTQPVSGPESLALRGQPERAAAAQRLLDENLPPGQQPPPLVGREAAMNQGATNLDTETRTLQSQAAAAGEPKTRLPGGSYGVPEAEPFRKQVGALQGQPDGLGPDFPKDSVEAYRLTLQRMKDQRAVTPPDQLPALNDQIARLEQNIAAKAPLTVEATQASDKGAAFDAWRKGLKVQPEPTPPPSRIPEAVAGAADLFLPGAFGRPIAAGIRGLQAAPGLLDPAVAAAVADPQQLHGLLEPETFLQLLKGGPWKSQTLKATGDEYRKARLRGEFEDDPRSKHYAR